MEQPNFLIIMCDQMTPLMTGTYGHPVVKTPNIDRLAAEGVRFERAYTSCPVCSPARASFMTGKHISKIRAYDNSSPVSSDELTFAHQLTLAGYDTVLSGKMHFIGPDQLHGFKRRLTHDITPTNLTFTKFTYPRDEGVKYSHTEDEDRPIGIEYINAGPRQWSIQNAFDEETHFRGIEYLYSRRMQVGGSIQKPPVPRDPTPFCLCVSYSAPHEPFHVTGDLWDLYADAEIELPPLPRDLKERHSQMDKWLNSFHGVDRVKGLLSDANRYQLRRAYFGMITYVDRKVGELMQALDATGLRENTIVIFLSDHGEMLGDKGMVQKRSFYEQSSRIPMIMQFPDGKYGGTVRSELVSIMDVTPTLLDLAGVAVEQRVEIDGRSLMGLLDGTDQAERTVISEYHSEGVYAPCFMVCRGNYKYIYIHGREAQLFDLERDPEEWDNLSGKPEHRTIEEELRRSIFAKFDPEAIEDDIVAANKRKHLIHQAMVKNRTSWDYDPHVPPHKAAYE